ncbi:hypothetical protein [Novosphingobium malaysiense]|uniref:Lipoprotein n=1 Tax=Novosphingobium malaysiense TaxID=1348853 RepID=A0A0B1ZPF1_9SPHN|nr:hypothetical protein [Novosphingobium malaysiense]KHK91057.1 hypothetical protein LK12_09020 [Novosphingobium malaysiense]
MQTRTETSFYRKVLAGLAVMGLSLLAAACIFAPGKFSSELNVRKDRTFSFRYTGEILMVPMMEADKKKAFEPEACHDEDTYDERECSEAEIAEQKTQWAQEQSAKKKSEAQAAQMMMGGMDPSNPEAGKAMAEKLSRQAGWNRVEYVGHGKFDVDFSVSGALDRDFVFPTMEEFPMSNAFVQVSLRKDGTVRIDAPGFGPPSGSASMAGMMSGMAKESKSDDDGVTADADGTFTVLTDASILANNTDEGPKAAPGGQTLLWNVNPRIKAAPTALLKMEP